MIKELSLKIDPTSVKNLTKYLNSLVGNEFNRILEPCYQPKFSKYYHELCVLTGYNEDISKKFLSGLKLTYIKKFPIFVDKINMMLLMSSLFYGYNDKPNLSKLFYYALSIKNYGNLTFRYLKFCNPEYWSMSQDMLSKKHLISIKGGISPMIMYISDEVYRKFEYKIKKDSLTEIDLISIVYEMRTRLNQSFKSFMKSYFNVSNNYNKMKQKSSTIEKKDSESRIGEVEETNLLITLPGKLSEYMCTYGQIDLKAMGESLRTYNINKYVAESLVKEFSKIEHKNDINFIYVLIVKSENPKNFCNKHKMTTFTKSIVSDKIKFGNYSLRKTISNLIDENALISTSVKNINKNVLIGFMSMYFITYLKNRIC